MSSSDSQSATSILESGGNAELLRSREAALLEGSVLLRGSVGDDLLSENVNDVPASTPSAVNGDFSASAIADEASIPVENGVTSTDGNDRLIGLTANNILPRQYHSGRSRKRHRESGCQPHNRSGGW